MSNKARVNRTEAQSCAWVLASATANTPWKIRHSLLKCFKRAGFFLTDLTRKLFIVDTGQRVDWLWDGMLGPDHVAGIHGIV